MAKVHGKGMAGRDLAVGLAVNTSIKPCRDVMLGWMRCLNGRDGVEPRFFSAGSGTTAESLSAFVASGVDALVLCGLRRDTVFGFLKATRLRIPVVLCAYTRLSAEEGRLLSGGGAVFLDNAAIGRHVGELFLEHGLSHFAFMAMNLHREALAGRIRCDAFRTMVLRESGNTFSERFFGECRENEDYWDEPREEVVAWVKSLPLPCGVFANCDYSANNLLGICRSLGIDVPGQIEVWGVNNSYGLCENMVPAISSVQPDYGECGRLAAEMALDLARGDGRGADMRLAEVSTHWLVDRGSSLSGRNHGKIVTRAKEIIRAEACCGISVSEVAKQVGVSRRTLEVSVKYATGESVLGLISRARLENIRRLLAQTDLSVAEIVTRSGYNLNSNAGAHFKRTYGMTMHQYRQKCHPRPA